DHGSANCARQTGVDGLPRVTAVLTSVHTEVILGIETLWSGRMHRHPVDALAEFRKALVLRKPVRLNPFVRRLPRRTAVGGPVDPGGGHGHHELLWVGGMRQDR